mmetsp:Transcript_37352/g.117529  ORF Transcript_37352/g.117529 Transcript_37352/m.117529 type:complete len:84 (+) Transcript_37352:110-361(+)
MKRSTKASFGTVVPDAITMLADGVAPDTVMYNAVINACEKSGRVRAAFDGRAPSAPPHRHPLPRPRPRPPAPGGAAGRWGSCC